MPKKSPVLQQLLQVEAAKKGQSGILFFALFSFLTYVYGFNCVEFLPYIRAISVILMIITIFRHFHYGRIVKKNSITPQEWRISFITITLNGFFFGLVFALAGFELAVSGPHYIVLTVFVAGITASSIVNLSYAASIFIPFQIFLLLPQLAIITYYHFSSFALNDFTLIFLYIMFFIYQIRQFMSYHKDLVKMFVYQIELEKTNKELKESKDIIVDQTLKLVHTSRLAVLGEMSVGIAHEINNPLSVISTSAQMLSRMEKSNNISKEIISSFCEKTNKSVGRISSIVNGLKLLSNQSDRVPKKDVLAEDILKETTPFCQEHFIAMGIKLEVHTPKEIMLHCHPVQISQVIINLLKNAADALIDEDSEEKWIKLDYKKEGHSFYFIISNGGPKISRELSTKIFTPFMTTKKHGTGIGLSISQAIMKEHGGEVYLDYDNFEHTTFIMKLPLITQ